MALVIGVESYQSVNKALYANTDAKQFHNLMRNTVGVGAENIKTLSNEKASRSEILSAFKFWLPSHVQKGKTHVYVFFSGHGLRSDEDAQKYWLPTDANKGLLGETAIAAAGWMCAETRAGLRDDRRCRSRRALCAQMCTLLAESFAGDKRKTASSRDSFGESMQHA